MTLADSDPYNTFPPIRLECFVGVHAKCLDQEDTCACGCHRKYRKTRIKKTKE